MPIRVPGFVKRNGQRPRNWQIDISKKAHNIQDKVFQLQNDLSDQYTDNKEMHSIIAELEDTILQQQTVIMDLESRMPREVVMVSRPSGRKTSISFVVECHWSCLLIAPLHLAFYPTY